MAIPILRAKFRTPVYNAVLRRERLYARLDEALSHPLTLIVGDAGFGKSALVVTYLEERRASSLWFRLDRMDRDLDVLFAHLGTALASLFPNCETRLSGFVARLGQRHHSPEELTADLIAALELPLRRSLVIVLDDFETVQDDAEIISAIHLLTLLLPETIRLLILSRVRPTDLPLTRLGLEGRLAVINRADLAFTREETCQLFSTVYGIELSLGEAEVLHQHCEGWPAGLRLVHEVLSRAANPQAREAFWVNLARSSNIFQYLWTEALAGQAASTQDFLIRTSVLASLEPTITDALLGIACSHRLLDQLERTQLFIYAEGSERETFRYHTLFHSFLHDQLLEREGNEGVRQLHERAADLYERRGDYNDAVAHYLAAREYVRAAEVMARVVDLYPPRTFLRLFDGWLEQETPDARMAYPSIFIRRVLLLETLERLLPALEEMLAESIAVRDLLRQAHAHNRLAIVHFYHCDIEPALNHYRQCTELFHRLHDPVMEALSLSDMGYLHWLAGDTAQARALCQQALELCDRHRLTMPRMQCLWRLAMIALSSGELERAERVAQLALQSGGEREDQGASTYPTVVLAWVSSARGEYDAAIRFANQTLAHAQASGIRLDQGWAALCAGTVYLRAGDLAAAQPFLTQAVHLLHGYSQPELAALSRVSALQLRQGQVDTARQRLTQALNIALAHNLDYPLLLEIAENAALLAFALENDLYTDHLLELVPRLPETALTAVRQLTAEPGQAHRSTLARTLTAIEEAQRPSDDLDRSSAHVKASELEFRTLGCFAVRCGATDLTPELNRRRSCRRLLLFLLANRLRAVPRDQIIEALWPQVSPASGENRFHIALSWLRRILEPGITSGSDSQTIQRRDDRYQLAADACQIDANEFVRLATPLVRGRQLRRLEPEQEQGLTRATLLYGGDFLQDYPYEEFLNEERAYLRELQQSALLRLGEHYRARRQANEALRCYKAALTLDPCREDIHRRVIFAHLLAGECALGIRAWQNCLTFLRDEMDVSPSPATQALGRHLLGAIN